jgi:serine/threonine protein kinase
MEDPPGTPPAPSPSSGFVVGTAIGKYVIESEIGRGGMGIVYRGIQKSLNREVAIKVLPPHLASDKDSVDRFIQEANLIARLNHEHIVRIYDIEEKQGAYFIIMEYLDGIPLDRIIRKGEIEVSREEIIAFMHQVCDALDCTHRHGIIHRDVKSANIFITRDRRVKLMDFGISKMTSSTLTTGMALGTPSYMSPEQAKGETLDPSTDIYSLGVVLYECLTGRLPFTGEDAFSVALKHISEPPPDPVALDPGIPLNLARCCLACLEKDRSRRFRSCRDLSSALRGKWPGYLDKPTNFLEDFAFFLNDIFEDRMFLPGISLISLLIAVLILQQVQSRHPGRFRLPLLPPPPHAEIMKSPPSAPVPKNAPHVRPLPDSSGEPSPHPDPPPPAEETVPPREEPQSPSPAPTPDESDLERIDLAIDANRFQKALSILEELKRTHGEHEKILAREEKLRIRKQKIDLLHKVNDHLKARRPGEALKIVNHLRALHPEDALLRQQHKSVKAELRREKRRMKHLARLRDLEKSDDIESLLEEAALYRETYPADASGARILQKARERFDRLRKNEMTKKALEEAKVLFAAEQYGRALQVLTGRLSLDPKNLDLLKLEQAVRDKIREEKFYEHLEREEKELGGQLKKLSRSFSNRDLDGYLSLLNPKKREFYLQEKRSAKNLFQLARDVYSSFSIANILIEGQSAKVSLFWKLSASFPGHSNVFPLFERQVEILFVKEENQWKLHAFHWIG